MAGDLTLNLDFIKFYLSGDADVRQGFIQAYVCAATPEGICDVPDCHPGDILKFVRKK